MRSLPISPWLRRPVLLAAALAAAALLPACTSPAAPPGALPSTPAACQAPPCLRLIGQATVGHKALFGGTTQLFETLLIRWTGSVTAPGWYMMAAVTVALLGALLLPEPPRQDRSDSGAVT